MADTSLQATSETSADPWVHLVGQSEARARLEQAATNPVHAYLLLGTRGSGTFTAALGFAGLLLASTNGDEAARLRAIQLAVAGKHPDLIVVEPEGAGLRVSEAEEIARASQRTPNEGDRKVIVVVGVESIEEAAIGKLLKVVEEPPPSTVFVLLAEEVPPEIVTIASRCVPIEFGPLSIGELEQYLIGTGIDPERSAIAAVAAGGDLERAKLLATDDDLANRAELWRQLPSKLDGSGLAVFDAVEQMQAGMDAATVALEARQATDVEELEARVEQLGERGSGRADLVARHKREVRKLRTDELRFGLATLARAFRDQAIAVNGFGPEADTAYQALEAIQQAAENLVRNPNESLLLQDLFLKLSPSQDRW